MRPGARVGGQGGRVRGYGRCDVLVTCASVAEHGAHMRAGEVPATCCQRERISVSGTKSASSRTQVVKNAFSWGFHFSAYNICPDKSF